MPHRPMIRTEIRENVTPLVRELAAQYWPAAVARGVPIALVGLCGVARSLLEPRDDWETPARAAGWLPEPGDTLGRVYLDTTQQDGEDETYYGAANWQEACARLALAAQPLAVLECWSVSEWLTDQLEVCGERVMGLGGVSIWARTSTEPLAQDETLRLIWRRTAPLAERQSAW